MMDEVSAALLSSSAVLIKKSQACGVLVQQEKPGLGSARSPLQQ
jgi:hypothetical protein